MVLSLAVHLACADESASHGPTGTDAATPAGPARPDGSAVTGTGTADADADTVPTRARRRGFDEPPPGATRDVGSTTVARSSSGRLRVETQSSRAAMVTGGDVRIAVEVPAHAAGALVLRLDGRDVTATFDATAGAASGTSEPNRPTPSDTAPQAGTDDAGATTVERSALLTGVQARSELVASIGGDASDRVALALVDHPLSGPVFAGPKLTPWVCVTQRSALGFASDGDCTVPTHYRWWYRGTDGQRHDLADPTRIPSGVASTRIGGRDVPYVVREESGVLDRSIYWITALDPDPHVEQGDRWLPTGWNGRLVYRYGGGCNTSYSQGVSHTNPNDEDLLERGYVVATGSLNTFQSLCQPVVSAEVTMVVKERVIERYGVPALTISDGGSGGSMQQLFIAQNYPGLLDGVTLSLPFPDLITSLPGITDCRLFEAYWRTPAGSRLTEAQRAAILGFASTGTCLNWNEALGGVLDPTDGCDPFLTPLVYDPVRNQAGVRCTVADANVDVFGRDPLTGKAPMLVDNEGVQYGLAAWRAGVITTEQFLDLNEHIGGFDADGRVVASRTRMTDATAATAYRSGWVSQLAGAGALASTPILLRNLYTDTLGDIHDRFRALGLRDRLRGADGSDDPNVVLWTVQNTNPDLLKALQGDDSIGDEPIFVMDDWLTAAAGGSGATRAEQLARAKPEGAVDRCDVDGHRYQGDHVHDDGPCHDAFPEHGDPRTVAGAPRRNDIVKCTRVAATPDASMDVASAARFARAFPTGVCDWSQPGVGQQPLPAVWPTYGAP